MSFNCYFCHRHMPPAKVDPRLGVKLRSPHQVVTQTRTKTYPERVYTMKGKKIVDPGGSGSEIVRQVNSCDKCFRVRNKATTAA